jgi:L-malate glycosyltransferase
MAQRPARVCFVVDDLGVAGIECQVLLLLKYLDRARVKPYLCLLRGAGVADDRLSELTGCPVVRLGVTALKRPAAVAAAWRFARFLRREQIDVVHPLHPDSLYFSTPVARLARVPCVVRFRVDLGFWMKPIDRWLGRILSRFLDASVANCEACRQAVVTLEGASPESIEIIPNGVELSRFAGVGGPGFAAGHRSGQVVGVVANLRRVKSLDLLVRAAAQLKSSFPDVRFQIAGEGESRAELTALAQQLGLGKNFELLGSVQDIPGFLRTLDVAVLCSSSEGSPNSIMEYMAAGLPVVCTDVGGCGELIDHEQNGLLVAPGNVGQLADAIARLLDNRELASRMGANARERALAEFGMDLQARRYEDFYHRLLHSKRRRGGAAWQAASAQSASSQNANERMR